MVQNAQTHEGLLGKETDTYWAKGPRNKKLNSIFPTKYEIPKRLKVSHWLNEDRERGVEHWKKPMVMFVCCLQEFGGEILEVVVSCFAPSSYLVFF